MREHGGTSRYLRVREGTRGYTKKEQEGTRGYVMGKEGIYGYVWEHEGT